MPIKIIMVVLLLLVVYLIYDNQQQKQQWQREQQQLNQSLQQLQETVTKQESMTKQEQQALIKQAHNQSQLLEQQLQATEAQNDLMEQRLQETEQQSELLEQTLQATEHQSKVLDQQKQTLDAVVEDLAMKQHQEQQRQAEYEALHQKALRASYRASGLQTGSLIKTYVAEYYMTEGRFPDSNTKLRLPRPESYASDTVKSITVSRGGRITIVYTAKSGMDGGAIVLTPRERNQQLVWQCTSRDFEDIQDTMPTCMYGG